MYVVCLYLFRYIHSKNRASLGYTLKVNHLADLTVQELKKMRGYRPSGKSSNALPFDKTQFKVNKIPDMLDWRLFGKQNVALYL